MPFDPLALLTRGARAVSPSSSSPVPIGLPLRAISAFGNLADLPGSMVRDLLVGENPFDQVMSPLSDTGRVSGRDVLSRYGMRANRETGMSGWLTDPGEALRDIAGFGIEYATDPFGPFGKLAKAAGLALGAGKLVSPLAAAAAGAGTALKAAAPKLMAALPTAAVAMVQKRAANPRAAKALAEGLQTLNKGDNVSEAVSHLRPSAPQAYGNAEVGYVLPSQAKRMNPLLSEKILDQMRRAGVLTPMTMFTGRAGDMADGLSPKELQWALEKYAKAFTKDEAYAENFFKQLAQTPISGREAAEALNSGFGPLTAEDLAAIPTLRRELPAELLDATTGKLKPKVSLKDLSFSRRAVQDAREGLLSVPENRAQIDAVRGRAARPYEFVTSPPRGEAPSVKPARGRRKAAPASPLASEAPPPTPGVLLGQQQLFDPETAPLTTEPQVVPPTAVAPEPVSIPEEMASAQRLADIRQSLDEFNAENPLPPASPPQSPLAQAAPEVTPDLAPTPPVKKRRAPRRKKAESPLADEEILLEPYDATEAPPSPASSARELWRLPPTEDTLLRPASILPEAFAPAEYFGSPLQQTVPDLNQLYSPAPVPAQPGYFDRMQQLARGLAAQASGSMASIRQSARSLTPSFSGGGPVPPAGQLPGVFETMASNPRMLAGLAAGAGAMALPYLMQGGSTAPARPAFNPSPDPATQGYADVPSVSSRPMTEQERLQRDEELRQMLLEQVINELFNAQSPLSGY